MAVRSPIHPHTAGPRVAHVVIGRERFSDRCSWLDLPELLGDAVAGRLELSAFSSDEFPTLARDADVIVPMGCPVDARLIRDGRFSLIHELGVGVDRIDLDAATRAGVWVANVPNLNAPDVAEHAIMLTLAALRRIAEAPSGFDPGGWSTPAGRSLAGGRVCIVGLGAIGNAITRRLQGFDVEIVGVRRDPRRGGPACAPLIPVFGPDRLADAVAGADAVILAAGHTPGQPPIVDGAVLRAMRPDAVLVNVGRGGLVDETALLAALDSGALAGAGLDVFAAEPYPAGGPLVRHPHVIATAHTAAMTTGYFRRAAGALAVGLAAYLDGQAPPTALNTLSDGPRSR